MRRLQLGFADEEDKFWAAIEDEEVPLLADKILTFYVRSLYGRPWAMRFAYWS